MYGKHPYSKHLDDVVNVVERFADEIGSEAIVNQLKIAALTHDSIEDTNVTKRDIEREFGSKIADLVDSVSNEPGRNRKEKHAKTYPKILGGGRRSMALKLADRIANVENCIASNHGLFGMYHKEHQGFVSKLKQNNGLDNMWACLEKLMSDNKHIVKRKKK